MVNSRALKQVREQRHFDVDAVADFLKIKPGRLAEFEEGGVEPSIKQLEKLAAIYGIPSYLFADDKVPNLREALPDFRKKEVGPASISPAGLLRVWNSEKVATATAQLMGVAPYKSPRWKRDVPTGQPSTQLALNLRGYFDEWLSQRSGALAFTGKQEQKFLAGLRLFLEVLGTIVRINDAPPSDYFGFFIEGDSTPDTIFINRKITSHKAQLFTLLHEYGHKLLGLSGISDPFKTRNFVERQCNKFAADFLAPLEIFAQFAAQIPRGSRSDVFDYVDRVSSRSLLSKHATAIRLVEAELITRIQLKSWEDARANFSPKELKEEDQDAIPDSIIAVPHAKRINEVGYLPIYVAGQALSLGFIESIDVQVGIELAESTQQKAFNLVNRRFKAASE